MASMRHVLGLEVDQRHHHGEVSARVRRKERAEKKKPEHKKQDGSHLFVLWKRWPPCIRRARPLPGFLAGTQEISHTALRPTLRLPTTDMDSLVHALRQNPDSG
ncbi:hypothetical protein ACVOMV_08060 [Mesorhizobium atlanticum]